MSKYLMAKLGQSIGDSFKTGIDTGYTRGMDEAKAYNRGVAEEALQKTPTVATQSMSDMGANAVQVSPFTYTPFTTETLIGNALRRSPMFNPVINWIG